MVSWRLFAGNFGNQLWNSEHLYYFSSFIKPGQDIKYEDIKNKTFHPACLLKDHHLPPSQSPDSSHRSDSTWGCTVWATFSPPLPPRDHHPYSLHFLFLVLRHPPPYTGLADGNTEPLEAFGLQGVWYTGLLSCERVTASMYLSIYKLLSFYIWPIARLRPS